MSCPPVFGTQPDFLELLLVLLSAFGLFSFLLVLELAVIHDFGTPGPDVRGHLDQVESRFDRQTLRFGGRQDPSTSPSALTTRTG